MSLVPFFDLMNDILCRLCHLERRKGFPRVILSMSRAVRESCDCSSVAACRARCARDANAAPRCACESNVRIIAAKDLAVIGKIFLQRA